MRVGSEAARWQCLDANHILQYLFWCHPLVSGSAFNVAYVAVHRVCLSPPPFETVGMIGATVVDGGSATALGAEEEGEGGPVEHTRQLSRFADY